MPRVGFEPTISAGEQPKTYALDRAATWTGEFVHLVGFIIKKYITMHGHTNVKSSYTVTGPQGQSQYEK